MLSVLCLLLLYTALSGELLCLFRQLAGYRRCGNYGSHVGVPYIRAIHRPHRIQLFHRWNMFLYRYLAVIGE